MQEGENMGQSRKRLLALCISVSLCSVALAGCGRGNTETAAETQKSTETQETAETQKPAEKQETTEAQAAEKAEAVMGVTTFPLPEGPEESEIYVEPIGDISDDFIRGMDASAVLAEENSGVTYYNYEGEGQDVFMTLAQAGVNYIRLRVWNDPYDENGNGYGGGNNDLATVIALGKRATRYGMKVSIDFHFHVEC